MKALQAQAQVRTGPRIAAFVVCTLLFFGALTFFPPFAQNATYHSFADRRTFIGVSNGANVLSSLPLVVVGAVGLWVAWRREDVLERRTLGAAFLGLFLTGVGSAYYHFAPTNERLFWDRLPLGLAAMSLLTLALAWYVSPGAHRLLMPLLALAGFVAATWRFGSLHGAGNLKWWWGSVEIYPVFAILLLMVLFRTSPHRTRTLFMIILCFAAAQLLDTLDEVVFRVSHAISGHTLKHLVGALAGVVLAGADAEHATD